MSNPNTLTQGNPDEADQWVTFRTALATAVSGIQPAYFQVQRHAEDPAWRERAYCYELYHLLRCQLTDNFPFTFHGEIDKVGHQEITCHFGRGSRPNPDFILHNPGQPGSNANFAVIEVKSSDSGIDEVKKDLRKLRKFLREVGYQHAVMFFFGSQRPPNLSRLGAIEALWHRQIGAQPIVSRRGRFDELGQT